MLRSLRVRELAVALLLAIVAPLGASAEVLLIDIGATPTDWENVINHLKLHGAWDLSTLPDFGVTSTAGPLTSASGGPIPAGFILDNVQIDSSRFFANAPITLAFIGPSANGFDNTQNAIVPNQPQDSLIISFSEPVIAFEFDAISCSNCAGATGLIDITITDNRGVQTVFADVAAPASGHSYGLVGTRGERISIVNLNGPGPEPGTLNQNQHFPGIQGASIFYGHGNPH